MNLSRKRRTLLKQFEQRLEEQLSQLQDLPARVEKAVRKRSTAATVATTAAWITGSVAVLAAGIYAGKQIRSGYKFKRRTPYDYYAHAGDRRSDLEFGVGI